MLCFEIATQYRKISPIKKKQTVILKLQEEFEITGFKPYILTIYKPQLENKIINLVESLFIFMIPNKEMLHNLHFLKNANE